MAGWKVREHIWRDEHGNEVLKHVKFLPPDGKVAFPWWYRYVGEFGTRWLRGKGEDCGIVPPLLYPLDVFARSGRSEHIYIAEGEKDADALIAGGVLAVTAGGVSEFGPDHARLFKGWSGRITVLRDNDAPGAWGAARTYGLLRGVGIPAARLRVARGRVRTGGADAHDHLSAGFTLDQFVSEPIARVRRIGATATPQDFKRAGYDRPPRYEGDPGWVHVSTEQAAQLNGWKPGRAS